MMVGGKKWNEKEKKLFKNPYAQFLKVNTDFVKLWQISEKNSLVAHVNAGVIWNYGNADFTPSNVKSLQGVTEAREIVRWAFNEERKEGDVSETVYESDNNYIVASLKTIRKKGIATFEQVRSYIEPQVRNEALGKTATAKKTGMLKPIKGNYGVYVVCVDAITPRAEQIDGALMAQQMEMESTQKLRSLFNVLKDRAKIVDNRIVFY